MRNTAPKVLAGRFFLTRKNASDIFDEALEFYKIKILSAAGNYVKISPRYETEVEANDMFKLSDDGYIVAPLDDVNELRRFVLQ